MLILYWLGKKYEHNRIDQNINRYRATLLDLCSVGNLCDSNGDGGEELNFIKLIFY